MKRLTVRHLTTYRYGRPVSFGPHRLMWGSDWPMTLLTAGYAGTWDVMSALIGELSADEQAQLLSGTADRVYRLEGSFDGRPVWNDFLVTRFGGRARVTMFLMYFAD